MIEYQERTIQIDEVSHVICDKCKSKISANNEIEFNEMFHIHFFAGELSVFGEGAEVRCDLCQHCVQELLFDYMRIESPYSEGISA